MFEVEFSLHGNHRMTSNMFLWKSCFLEKQIFLLTNGRTAGCCNWTGVRTSLDLMLKLHAPDLIHGEIEYELHECL